MIYDPHDDSFCAKNLREEEWVEYQRDELIKALVPFATAAFDKEHDARMSISYLNELGERIAMRAGTMAIFIQDSHHWFWASMAIAMLIHARFEDFPEENCVRFSRSKIEQEPMYYNNIEYVPCQGKSWLVPVRKRTNIKIDETLGMVIPKIKEKPQLELF